MKIWLTFLFVISLSVASPLLAQNYQSKSNGDWANSATWVRTPTCPAPSGWGTIEDSNHPAVPPIDSSWPDCPIDVVIKNTVSRSGGATFSQKFRSLKILSGGKMVFTSNDKITFSNNGYGAVEVLVDGGELEAYDLEIKNGAKINVINGGKLILRRDLITDGNTAYITIDATSSLAIGNELKIGGYRTSVNILGEITCKNIVSAGDATNALIFTESSKVSTDQINVGGAAGLKFQGKLSVNGPVKVWGSGKLEITGTSILNGSVDLIESGELKIPGVSTINSDVTLTGSGTLSVISDGDVLITGNLIKPQYSANINVLNQGQLVICNQAADGTNLATYPPTTYANMNIAPSPAYYGGCIIMPVEFSSFTAEAEKWSSSTLLAWTTAKEWQNSHFEIERSIDNITNWQTIGEVAGSGFADAATDYTFDDKKLPPNGGRIFYRIKQVNFDQKISYSSIQAITVEGASAPMKWTAYPNPTNGQDIKLELTRSSLAEDSPFYVILSSVHGQQGFLSGSSLDEINLSLRKELTQKKPGIYLLKVMWKDNSQTLTIVKN
jgi:hypothetical protein